MLALCLIFHLHNIILYYAKNYAGIISLSLIATLIKLNIVQNYRLGKKQNKLVPASIKPVVFIKMLYKLWHTYNCWASGNETLILCNSHYQNKLFKACLLCQVSRL